MIGRRVGHYVVVERLGGGGMGVVYKAEDTLLGRVVALKFLATELSDNPDAKSRFLREARAASQLDHNNICTIHDVGETGDKLAWIAMACYEGETLKAKAAHGPLEIAQAIEITLQIARGLARAHASGIVHRDIKPANVIITNDGVVKILDFGIAKIAGSTHITKSQSTLGTVAYMAPEQLRGEDVGPQADLWSLGIVLFELVTGSRPFSGDYEQAVAYSILNHPPASLPDLRPDAPLALNKVLEKLTRKDPTKRYATADELIGDLESLLGKSGDSEKSASFIEPVVDHRGAFATLSGMMLRRYVVMGVGALLAVLAVLFGYSQLRTTDAKEAPEPQAASPALTVPRKRIVVLPFENLGRPEDEYFAAGVTDEITSRLTGVRELAVISRNSATHYAESNKTTSQIGEELNVDYVLEGSVRWAQGNRDSSRVRITPRLIDVAADTHLWADSFDREIESVFEVQSEIAHEVVRQLGISLDGEAERGAIERRPTNSFAAYQAYLRANFYLRGPSLQDYEGLRRAVDSYQRAVELDPEFAVAWARLSSVHSLILHQGFDTSTERRDLAGAALAEAMRLDPDDGETHLSRALYYYWARKEYASALEEIRIAAERLPADAAVLQAKAFVERRQNRWLDAMEDLKSAAEIDPRNPLLYVTISGTLTHMRLYPEALAACESSLSLQPINNDAEIYRPWILWLWKGRDGLEETRDLLEVTTLSAAYPMVRLTWFGQLIFERTPRKAIESLAATDDEWIRAPWTVTTRSLLAAQALELAGDKEAARLAYTAAAAELQAESQRSPDDFRLPGALGIAYAGLGWRDEAIAAAERGVEMLPLSQDSFWGPHRIEDLARVYAAVGEHEAALEQIDRLLGIPAWFSVAKLELEPWWDPLRNHPGYDRMVKKHRTGR